MSNETSTSDEKVLFTYARKKVSELRRLREQVKGFEKRGEGFEARGEKIGIVVAIGPGKLGWSKLNSKDEWDFDFGYKIALDRAKKGSSVKPPSELKRALKIMDKRSRNYFK